MRIKKTLVMETYTINYYQRATVTLAAAYCRFNVLGGQAIALHGSQRRMGSWRGKEIEESRILAAAPWALIIFSGA